MYPVSDSVTAWIEYTRLTITVMSIMIPVDHNQAWQIPSSAAQRQRSLLVPDAVLEQQEYHCAGPQGRSRVASSRPARPILVGRRIARPAGSGTDILVGHRIARPGNAGSGAGAPATPPASGRSHACCIPAVA
ncbi:hypothetical protein RJ55_07357 [Drechmeria coniospora]|nr:hypothetical protein RJ55_07357 [Drechmeria coniospora]